MATAGNPNPNPNTSPSQAAGAAAGGFDMNMLFKPANQPAQPPSFPPSSYPPPPTSYPTPAPSGAFSYPPHTTPPYHHFLPPFSQDTLSNVHPQRPISYPAPPLRMPSPSPNPNHGARLMALLNSTPPSAPLMPTAPQPELSSPLAAAPSLPPVMPTPARMPSSKLPIGRHLVGDDVVYDIDVRLPGEVQPQLEVTPITKYVSDPGLVVGRQIAVNRTYICYGLKLGAIRVLNINTALRSLLRGHTQRVNDMAFFAEDVHLLASASIDGRVFVWKINEGPDEEDKPQITGKTVVALHIIGDGESIHPRVCWHSHKQEVLVVGIGKHVLKIDTTKLGKGLVMSAEEPLQCHTEKLIDGVQFIGKHEGEVTDLSMCQWMTTRLVSASTDGMIKIWEDRKALPLITLKAHNGDPVNSATFLAAPHRPDHVVLITAGHLNREVKIWASSSEEGWLLPSDAESWQCTQTLDLKSSAEPRSEEAFFNQVVVLPRSGLILLANAKRNAIYAVHIEYDQCPAATRMDYIAEFTVTMPILSLTGTSDCSPDDDHIVQVYCVQTQAIQQYALDLSMCLPPPLENIGSEKESSISHVSESARSDGLNMLDPANANTQMEVPIGNAASKPATSISESIPVARYAVFSAAPDLHAPQMASSAMEFKSGSSTDDVHIVSSPPTLSPRLSGLRSPSDVLEKVHSLGDHGVDHSVMVSADAKVDSGPNNLPDASSSDDCSGAVTGETKLGLGDVPILPRSPNPFKHPTHLVTPSEIISATSSEITHVVHVLKGEETMIQEVAVNNGVENAEVEVKVMDESRSIQHKDVVSEKEENAPCSAEKETPCKQVPDLNIEMPKECCLIPADSSGREEIRQVGACILDETLEQSNAGEDLQDSASNAPDKVVDSMTVAQSPILTVKGKKQKGKSSQVPGSSSPSPSPFNSTDSSNEPGCTSSALSAEALFPHILTIQETVNQLSAVQKEMQKQMAATVAVPVNKEGRRIETSLGRSMEKALKANSDALWARLLEENAKRDKLERERMLQITSLSNCISKDLPATIEKMLKKELSNVGPALARTITPVIEKTVSSAIVDSFQRGVGDKAVSQLEKSLSSKLEATIARQIQAQFQTSVKQALQDALKSNLEASLIPAFEMSCKAMFEQLDSAFHKGMVEHTAAAQQQFDAALSPLAHALRDALNSASSFTQTLTGELAESQQRFLALVAAGANQKAMNPSATPQSNGPLGNEMALTVQQIDPPMDPKVELQRLISEHKFGDAFTAALQRSDVLIVSWLCSQVDLPRILTTVPLPLSQGVLLALLQQLACDIKNDTSRKLDWMSEIAVAINPGDPLISMHVRPIFEQVYQMLEHHRVHPATASSDAMRIRLVMHVINSVLSSCK